MKNIKVKTETEEFLFKVHDVDGQRVFSAVDGATVPLEEWKPGSDVGKIVKLFLLQKYSGTDEEMWLNIGCISDPTGRGAWFVADEDRTGIFIADGGDLTHYNNLPGDGNTPEGRFAWRVFLELQRQKGHEDLYEEEISPKMANAYNAVIAGIMESETFYAFRRDGETWTDDEESSCAAFLAENGADCAEEVVCDLDIDGEEEHEE